MAVDRKTKPGGERRAKRQAAGRSGSTPRPAEKAFEFGDFHRFEPVTWNYGFSRGLPIDRFYIERFLDRHRKRIQGRVLEVEDRTYTVRFGGKKVVHSDVLHISADHALATVVADLADAPHIPSDHYDCIVLTQTLQYLYDTRAALRTLHRILRPGGTLLATVPGLSRAADLPWGASWYWNFTSRSAARLFADAFGAENVEAEGFGNLFVATAFLHGLAQSDISAEDMAPHDGEFEIVIAVCARK